MERTAERPFTITSTEQAGKTVEDVHAVSVEVPTETAQDKPERVDCVKEPEKPVEKPEGELLGELIEDAPEDETIPPTIPDEGEDATSQADSEKITKVGRPGRQRRYEEPGMKDIPPVKEVILFRHKMGRYWSGISKDMQDWYEHYYFTRPAKAERVKDAKEHERHVNSYNRGRKWIAEEEGTPFLGVSDKVLPYRRRAASDH